MSGSQRPLFMPAPVAPPGQMVQAPQANSVLAQAMARPQPMPAMATPSMGMNMGSLAQIMKPDPNAPPEYGSPNGDPSAGANATPEQMAAMLQPMQNGQIPQMGQPGAPIGQQLGSPDMMAKISQWLQGLRGGGG